MSETQSSFAFSDFVEAWRFFRVWGDHEYEMGAYARVRYAAFAGLFGADLDQVPDPAPPVPGWLADPRFRRRSGDERPASVRRSDEDWAEYVHRFVLSVEETARRTKDPWSGMMEAPESIHAIYRRYSHDIKAKVERAREEMLSMSTDLLAEMYPDAAQKTVTAAELRAAGFDPDLPEPDPWDD